MATDGMGQDYPAIAAVIPTTGRASLTHAVQSALDQTVRLSQVVVAVDGPVEQVTRLPEDPRIEVVSARPFGTGGNAARSAGLARVRSGLVALLDDDDVWHPDKIERQLECYREARQHHQRPVVVGCRVREVRPDGQQGAVMPRRLLRSEGSVAGYLFDRQSVFRAAGTLSSSMLLFDREIVDAVPFDAELSRHQDWDWLLRVDHLGLATFTMAPEVLVDYAVSLPGASTSSAAGWKASEAWVAHAQEWLTPRQQAEVLLAVTTPIAMKHGEWRAAARLVRKAVRLSPAPASVAFALAHVPVLLWRRARKARAQRRVSTVSAPSS